MSRFTRFAAQFVRIALSSLALALPSREAHAQAITITITPTGKLVTAANRQIAVSVKFCMPWGGTYWVNGVHMSLQGNEVTELLPETSSGQDATCDIWEIYSGTITLNETPQMQEFRAWAYDYYNALSEQFAYYAIPAKGRAVLVASTAGFVDVKPWTSNTQTFTVWNAGELATTFTFSASCWGAASGCSVSQQPGEIVSGGSGTAAITYTASGTVGDTGVVKLTASEQSETPYVEGAGWADVTVKAAPAAGVALAKTQALISRGSCVTASLGSDVAMECGDLRIVHALPAVTTLGKTRVPTLVYNSQHARPIPVALADVTLPSGSLPTTVEARVYVDGVLRGSRNFAGSDWSAGGNTRRIAVDIDASGYPTSLKAYYVQVTLIGGPGGTYNSVVANLAIVNRQSSPYGAGWWLAGLEEIYFINSSTILWVGGDGSTNAYVWNGVSFRAWDFIRRDSITTSGSDFIRWGPAKLQVRFNSTGLHTSTTNRLGQVTTFSYVPGTRKLSSISVPVRTGSPLVYTFNWAPCDYSVTAPSAGGGAPTRTVEVETNSCSQVAWIRDPDGQRVFFAYGSGANAHRIETRTDRRWYATSFYYNSANQLTGSSLNGQGIAYTLRAAESRGLGESAQPLDSVYTLIDGPRSDVIDETKIWINEFGAPTRIRNAEGRETALWYDNTWVGLVAQVRTPSRLLTKAIYNSDATLQSTTVYNPLGTPGQNATTTYTWDPVWKFVTSITPPAGPVSEFAYIGTTGNRDWEQTGGSSRRVTYSYNGLGLLAVIYAPEVPPTNLAYNDLGNVSEITSPKGFKTFILQNAIGQDTLIASPFRDTLALAWGNIVPEGAANGSRVVKRYTIVGQDSVITTHGPQVTNPITSQTVNRDSVRLEHVYDAEGNVETTRRWFTGGFLLESSWSYDGAGRKLTEDMSGADTKFFGYDPAGNVTSVHSPNGFTVTMTYDALNRLKKRIVPQRSHGSQSCMDFFSWQFGCSWSFPAIGSSLCINSDTAKFEYEPGGNIYRADNRYAKITRSYKPNGLLAAETQQIRAWSEPGDTPCGATVADPLYGGIEWNVHSYTLSYTYDLAGRRLQLDGPYKISSCLQNPNPCRTSWAYNGSAGELSSVTDGLGRTTTFTYDNASRLTDITFPNGIEDHLGYDDESRVVSRTVYGGTYINDQVSYDAAGRILRATVGVRNGQPYNQNVDSWYGPLGAVIAATGATESATGTMVSEVFNTDGLGNRTFTKQLNIKPTEHPDQNGERYYSYDGYKRLTQVLAPAVPGFWSDKNLEYDNAGNVIWTKVDESDAFMGGATRRDVGRNYYDAGDRLAIFNRATGPFADDEHYPGQRNVFEEYRYDALGRRVSVRARRSDTCHLSPQITECLSYVERTVWDGDQVIYETRTPGRTTEPTSRLEAEGAAYSGNEGNAFGQTAYVHAGGIDQPVVVMRMGYNSSSSPVTVYPHQNWRGLFEVGTTPSGTLHNTPAIAWPGAKSTVDAQIGNPTDGPIWFGGLIPGKTDGSGMQYMRNRYYDPATGRFTQQDPIGLAGGMNAYGFAGGDPINFSDPLGLNECSRQNPNECTKGDVGRNVLNGMASLIDGGADTGPGFRTGQAIGVAGFFLPSIAATRLTSSTALARNRVLDAAKAQGRPGFELTPMSAEAFASVAEGFAGRGARLSGDGKALVSRDALYVALPPAQKGYGKVTGNLVVKNSAGDHVINAHVPIYQGPRQP